MPDRDNKDVVLRKQAIYKELKGALVFLVTFVLIACLGGIGLLEVQVLQIINNQSKQTNRTHQDTVNIITAAAWCASHNRLKTYNDMVDCINKEIKIPIVNTPSTGPSVKLSP